MKILLWSRRTRGRLAARRVRQGLKNPAFSLGVKDKVGAGARGCERWAVPPSPLFGSFPFLGPLLGVRD